MEKIEVALACDGEKLEALEHYARKSGSSVQKRLDEALRSLYEELVPKEVREYLDSKTGPTRPKRPTPQPKVKPQTQPPKTEEKKEGSEHGQP